MLVNRSMPASNVVPVLVYEDVGEAVEWRSVSKTRTATTSVPGSTARGFCSLQRTTPSGRGNG